MGLDGPPHSARGADVRGSRCMISEAGFWKASLPAGVDRLWFGKSCRGKTNSLRGEVDVADKGFDIGGRERRSCSMERRSRSGDMSAVRGLRKRDMKPLRPGPAVAGGLGSGSLGFPNSAKLAEAGA